MKNDNLRDAGQLNFHPEDRPAGHPDHYRCSACNLIITDLDLSISSHPRDCQIAYPHVDPTVAYHLVGVLDGGAYGHPISQCGESCTDGPQPYLAGLTKAR